MLVGVLDLLLITMVFFKISANLRILQWKVKKLQQPSNQNHPQPRNAMFLPQMTLKTTI